MRVPCSACADWPRALQKHKQRATRNSPALSPTQVTLGHDAERQLTREKLLHTHSACLSTAARAYSSEKHAPLQSATRKQLTSGRIFFVTHSPPSPASPAPRRGSESELSFAAKSQHSGFWPRLLDQSSPRSQDQRVSKKFCVALLPTEIAAGTASFSARALRGWCVAVLLPGQSSPVQSRPIPVQRLRAYVPLCSDLEHEAPAETAAGARMAAGAAAGAAPLSSRRRRSRFRR